MSRPIKIHCTVIFHHISEPFKNKCMSSIDTLSELKGVFNHFFTLNNDFTRRVKHFVHVTSYYSLVDDTDDYKISYDIKTLDRDIDM